MKKLVFAVLILSVCDSQALITETIENIVTRLTKANSLSEELSQQLADRLEEFKKKSPESAAQLADSSADNIADNIEITPALLDVIAPYVLGKSDPLIVEWLFTSIRNNDGLNVARALLEKDLVDPNVVDSTKTPLLHRALFKKWNPDFIDLLIDKGADLEARNPFSGDTPLLALPNIGPSFEDSYDFRLFNDKHRMQHLIARGANVYAVNNKNQETLANRVKDNFEVRFWSMQDACDFRDYIIEQQRYKLEGAQLPLLLPAVLNEYLPAVTYPIIGRCAHSHFGLPLPEGDPMGDYERELNQFFAGVIPVAPEEAAEDKRDE